jgi:hypothetical protein
MQHAIDRRRSRLKYIWPDGTGGAAVAIAAWDATNRPGMGKAKLHRRLVTTVPAGSSSVQ